MNDLKDKVQEKMRIVIARADRGDWEVIFVDGKPVYDGHGIDLLELLETLGFSYELHTRSDVDRGFQYADLFKDDVMPFMD